MPKVPKKYKVESRSLTKKINEIIQNPEKISGLDLKTLNQIMNSPLSKEDYSILYKRLNPGQKQYVDLNIGNPASRGAGFIRSEKPSFEKISNLTPWQSDATRKMLEMAMPTAFLPEDATQEQITQAESQGLPGLLQQLGKPSQLESQLQSMFGQMQNPIIQGIINPSFGQPAPQVLFPSQLAQQAQQQQSGGLENILGQLAQQYGPQLAQYGVENAPDIYNYLQENVPAAFNYAKESRPAHFLGGLAAGPKFAAETAYGGAQYAGQGIKNLLGMLGNYFNPQQQNQ